MSVTLDGTPIHKLPSIAAADLTPDNSFFVGSVNRGAGVYEHGKVGSKDLFEFLGLNAHSMIEAFNNNLLLASNSFFHYNSSYDGELVAGEVFGNFFSPRDYVLTTLSAYLQAFAVGAPVAVYLYDITNNKRMTDTIGNELEPITLLSQSNRQNKTFTNPPLLKANTTYGFEIDSVGRSVKGSNLNLQMVYIHPDGTGYSEGTQPGGAGGGTSEDLDVFTFSNVDLTASGPIEIFTVPDDATYIPLIAYVEYITTGGVSTEPQILLQDASAREVFTLKTLDSTFTGGELDPLSMEASPPKLDASNNTLSLNVVVPAAASSYIVDVHVKLFRLS